MNRILLLIIGLFSIPLISKAQFYNNSVITTKNDALLFVDMDVIAEGKIYHEGKLIFNKNWYTQSSFGGISPIAKGTVVFSGNNQTVGGSFKSNFPNVVLLGTGKKDLDQNVDIYQSLFLNDSEFAVGTNTLKFLSDVSENITKNQGFISTKENGFFYRSMLPEKEYLFPMGSKEAGLVLFRPVKAILKNNEENTVGVSFVHNDPDYSSYNRNSKRENIEAINPKYFHVLNAEKVNTLADISFLLNTNEEDPYKELASWVNGYIWEKIGFANGQTTVENNLNKILSFNTKKIENLPIALASSLTAGNLTFYNSFSPDGDGKNDVWSIGNIDSYPDNDITIFNRWGGEVFKTKSYSSTNRWDGSKLNEGTYYYLLNVKIGTEYKTYKGFISLIRNSK